MKNKSLLLAPILCGLASAPAHAITMYALAADGDLYSFDTASPGIFNNIGTPTNAIIDLDFRGSNGTLYGIAGSGSTYTIDLLTGATSLAFSPSTTLNGMVSGFDVNPAADRFRVVTDASMGNNNYRLSSPGNDDGTTSEDGTFDAGPTILDVAYRNPFDGASGTTLYSVGSDGDLYTHFTRGGDPGGSFNGRSSSGPLGFVPGANIAFDVAQDGNGYIADGTTLYRVNGIGSVAPSVDNLGTLALPVTSFSAVPEPSSALSVCLAGVGFLRRRR